MKVNKSDLQESVLRKLNTNSVRLERSVYKLDNENLLLFRTSKEHKSGKKKLFWFGFHRDRIEKVDRDKSFFLFVCAFDDQVIVLPANRLEDILEGVSTAKDDNWKIRIFKDNGLYELHVTGKTGIDVTQYLNRFDLLGAKAQTKALDKKDPLNEKNEKSPLIERLNLTQFKSDSPNEFESAIRDGFEFLGFEGELLGGSGDTDVLLTANIGQESYKISVDGKTSKSGKIIERQIDWLSLTDHQNKNKSNFIVVVGASFAGGNLLERARQNEVSLLRTEDFISLVKAHNNFPFTLIELQDLFTGKGDISNQVEDLLSQNSLKRRLLEQFRVIIEEMQSLQDWLGYFTFDSLAGRERIESLDIIPKDIEYIISLLRLPFINGVQELSPGKYILAIRINDISNIFFQISNLLVEVEFEKPIDVSDEVEYQDKVPEFKEIRTYGTKYFNWFVSGSSIVAEARREKPYKHHCPIEHFKTIVDVILEAYQNQNIVYVDLILEMLKNRELSPNRPFKGRTEDYKIRMTLGIMEIEELIKWTGSKRPIEYILKAEPHEIDEWFQSSMSEQS